MATMAITPGRCQARRGPLVSIIATLSVVAGTWLWKAPLQVVPVREPSIEAGEVECIARQAMAMHALIRILRRYHSVHAGNSYDANAMCESWRGSPMNCWVDHAGPFSSERLENELMSMRIGGKTGTHPQRLAMQARRLAKQRELEKKEKQHANAMLHWADHPAAIISPTQLEEELTAMEIGHVGGLEGRRGAMRLQRLARQHALAQASSVRPSCALKKVGAQRKPL
mmetsp:Transcript_102664/g.198997  ORF Transcript_102664/g.198997 Transcript_102664/m.198997 type:complete len:227 (-) Transcript_102664:274-954(-)